MKDYIVTVMARDRVGIVRDVSTGLFNIGGDITHVSQTVMRGYFTLILSVEVPDDRTQLEIRQAVERQGAIGEFEVNVRPYEEPINSEEVNTERFTLSLRGLNQSGVISHITNYLAERNINIDDFYAYAYDGRFVMLVQISIPTNSDVEAIQNELAQAGKEYGLVVHLQHENIFRAISEIRPVIDLG